MNSPLTSLGEFKETLKTPLREATVSFVVKDGQVLLGMKKRGFGTSKWNGYGGKQDPNESIEDTAMREVKEESGIQVTAQRRRAVLDYYFVDAPEWGQRVSVFLVDTWDGEPQETEEMLPHWYPLDEIPYSEMWADDQHWLPLVLREGRTITGGFLFNREGELLEFTISEVEFLPQ